MSICNSHKLEDLTDNRIVTAWYKTQIKCWICGHPTKRDPIPRTKNDYKMTTITVAYVCQGLIICTPLYGSYYRNMILVQQWTLAQDTTVYDSVLGKHPRVLKRNLWFRPAWALTQEINCIHICVEINCYIDSTKFGAILARIETGFGSLLEAGDMPGSEVNNRRVPVGIAEKSKELPVVRFIQLLSCTSGCSYLFWHQVSRVRKETEAWAYIRANTVHGCLPRTPW